MFVINGEKATLRQFNRTSNDSMYDDTNYQDITIKVCPYDAEQLIRFGIYTNPEATGYYQVPRYVDIQPGDQIIFIGNFFDKTTTQKDIHTVLEVHCGHLFNRVENKIAVVK